MKKVPVIFISLLIGVSSLWAQQVKMIVKVDRAVVYADPNENSYKIDTVRSGTVLTVFERGIESSEWIYVTFESKRWKGKVTGFIKADLVFTEEEWLREDQRRMEEEAQKMKAEEVVGEPEEKTGTEKEAGTEAELKAKAETTVKPQDELPDLRAAFAKQKPEEPEEKEVLEKPQQDPEKQEPAPVVEEPTPFKEEEAPPKEKPAALMEQPAPKEEESTPVKEEPAPEIKEEVKEKVAAEESKPVAEELKPVAEQPKLIDEQPEPLAGEKVEVKEPEPTVVEPEAKPEPVEVKPEEKEILEETPRAKEVATPETRMVEEEEFKKPEPPPPAVTITDGITESPPGRSLTLYHAGVMAEGLPFAIIMKRPEPHPKLIKAEEKVVDEAPAELQADVMPVKEEVPPPPAETEKKKEEKEEEPQSKKSPELAAEPPEQVVKPPEQVVSPPEQIVQPTEKPQIKQPPKVGFLSFGVGYGPSWGGFGGAFQLNVSKNISIHLGGGMYPTKSYYSDYDWVTNKWLYSIGIKYYLPLGSESFRPYVDLMYGGIAVEAVQIVKEIWYYQYTYENIQKVLYGPSIVGGADLKLGFLGLTGYLGLSYNTTAWDYWNRNYFLNGGLGISLYF